MPTPSWLPALSQEFSSLSLDDTRLDRRARFVVDRLGEDPSASLPDLFDDDAELEGTYRLFNNPSVQLSKLLAAHAKATVQRVAEAGAALVVHDTTQFEFSGQKGRKGLRPLRSKKGKAGFLGHTALAIADDGTKRPLGVLGLIPIVRKAATAKRKKMTESQRRKSPDSEFRRWGALVEECETKLAGLPQAIHVMDREGDDYALLALLAKRRFVIRLHHDRKVCSDGEFSKVSEVLSGAKVHCTREVNLSRRLKRENSPAANKRNPPRAARKAQLEIRGCAVEYVRPHHADRSLPPTLNINLVHVREVSPPADAEPVDWVLLTTEPIDTAKDVERVVDIYRCRWLIEEYFQALKTGCMYESRQLESKHALFAALGFFVPVAWRLLLMRATARHSPKAPAQTVLSETQLDVLRAVAKKPLSDEPTAHEVLMAVARLGGHIKHNGDPGWRVLARGYEKLLAYEIGWNAREDRGACMTAVTRLQHEIRLTIENT